MPAIVRRSRSIGPAGDAVGRSVVIAVLTRAA
jgi:hypothetical protein